MADSIASAVHIIVGAIADRSSRRARLRAAKQRLEAEVRDAQDAHAAHLQARAA